MNKDIIVKSVKILLEGGAIVIPIILGKFSKKEQEAQLAKMVDEAVAKYLNERVE